MSDELERRKYMTKIAKRNARANGCTCQVPYPKFIALSYDEDDVAMVDMRHQDQCVGFGTGRFN